MRARARKRHPGTSRIRLQNALPSSATVLVEPLYEHLDYLWGRELTTRVYPVVLQHLRKASGLSGSLPAGGGGGERAGTGDAASSD